MRPGIRHRHRVVTRSTAIERLPATYRQIIRWRDEERRSVAEIAHLLDLEPAAAQTLLTLARAKLDRLLQVAASTEVDHRI